MCVRCVVGLQAQVQDRLSGKTAITIGNTGHLGRRAAEDKIHVHDFHDTILRLVGVGHTCLVHTHKGRPESTGMNEGNPLTKIRA